MTLQALGNVVPKQISLNNVCQKRRNGDKRLHNNNPIIYLFFKIIY